MTAHPIDTEELRLLADAAAPGPWHYIPGDHDLASAGIDITAEGDSLTWDDHSGEVFTHPDAEFIAAAREAVPALLDRIARLEAQSDIRGRAVVIYRERARQVEARIRTARAIHRDLYESMSGFPYCDECDRDWPCPTIRALDGDA